MFAPSLSPLQTTFQQVVESPPLLDDVGQVFHPSDIVPLRDGRDFSRLGVSYSLLRSFVGGKDQSSTGRVRLSEARPLMSRPRIHSLRKQIRCFSPALAPSPPPPSKSSSSSSQGALSLFVLLPSRSLVDRRCSLGIYRPPSGSPVPLSSSPPWSRFLLYLIAQHISGMRRPAACRTPLNVMQKFIT